MEENYKHVHFFWFTYLFIQVVFFNKCNTRTFNLFQYDFRMDVQLCACLAVGWGVGVNNNACNETIFIDLKLIMRH